MSRRISSLVPILAVMAAGACDDDGWTRPEVDRSQVQVMTDRLLIKTGPVGEGQWRSDATYVLVEARNQSEHDVDVTLAGELHDAAGQTRWPARRESLRIPAGGSRLFALIDAQQAARPGATGARVDVVGASAVRHPPNFILTDGKVVMDQDRAVAAGYLLNSAERDGSVILIGAFFDQAGAPLQRTSTLFRMAGGGKRGVQLVGPPGSRSAYLFVGDSVY